MDITNLDFRQLILFIKLYNTNNVSICADELGISQPAASRSLSKLRRFFGDELFVKIQGAMLPTPLANKLFPQIEALLHRATEILRPDQFNPEEIDQIFTLISTDYGLLSTIRPILPQLIKEAPKLRLEIRPMVSANLKALQQGEIDFMLYSDDELPEDYYKVDLFVEHHICLVDKNNPLAKEKNITLDMFNRADHAMVNLQGSRFLMNDDIYWDKPRSKRKIKIWIPNFHLSSLIIQNTDLLLTLPSQLKEYVDLSRLVEIPLPISSPSFTYRLIWHKRTHHSPAHQWLRKFIKSSIGPI